MSPPTSRPVLFSFTILAMALVAAAAILTGCASPAGIAPSHALAKPADVGLVPATEADAWPDTQWWKAYNDPVLNAMIDGALADQPSLQTVAARLAQAAALVDVQRSATRPQVNGSVDVTDQRFSATSIYPPPIAGSIRWTADARASLSWDLDIAGGRRAALEAAIGQQRAAMAEGRAAALAVSSNVAAGYVALARLVALREVAVRTQGTRNEVQRLVRQRIGAGLDTNVELRQSEALIAQTQVDTEQIDESIERARHALAELTGQGPQAYATLSPVLSGVSSVPLPGGLPADLIGRRPDLVAARWRVEAATQDVKAARAQFYPNVNLAAFVGLSSLGLDNFFKLDSRSFGAGPAIRLPIFDAGRLRAGLKQRTGEVDVAVDSYNSALLRAVREVADEVSTLRSIERQQRSQADALTASESSYSLATDRYRAGLGTLLTVLSAEGSVLTQRRATTDLKARHLNAEVALVKALGGGFKEDDIAATSPIASSSVPAVAAAPMARSLVAAAPPSNKSKSLEVSP